jgi:uracil-DNA glycosylase family 4
LRNCRITNAVRCLPPENRPKSAEVKRCNRYLSAELAALGERPAILALGRIAHQAVLMASGLAVAAWPFAHGARHALPGARTLFDSYHCSRYNTQTKRLTADMFREVFDAIEKHLAAPRTAFPDAAK